MRNSLVNTKSEAEIGYIKAFPVFNVLETCRVYLLTIDLWIIKCINKCIERFFE